MCIRDSISECQLWRHLVTQFKSAHTVRKCVSFSTSNKNSIKVDLRTATQYLIERPDITVRHKYATPTLRCDRKHFRFSSHVATSPLISTKLCKQIAPHLLRLNFLDLTHSFCTRGPKNLGGSCLVVVFAHKFVHMHRIASPLKYLCRLHRHIKTEHFMNIKQPHIDYTVYSM